MKTYSVRLTRQANEQIGEYAEYIQNKLLNPQAARKFVNDIKTAVKNLSQMPQRNPLTPEEPWHSMGVHRICVRGYFIYYWIEEDSDNVHVIGVVYEKRDQFMQLLGMDFE